jgi:hypothetical protein
MVEGLPCDATEREVAHIFRPFVGYKTTKVVHGDRNAHQNDKSKSEVGDSD